jgi:hypothetical protein
MKRTYKNPCYECIVLPACDERSKIIFITCKKIKLFRARPVKTVERILLELVNEKNLCFRFDNLVMTDKELLEFKFNNEDINVLIAQSITIDDDSVTFNMGDKSIKLDKNIIWQQYEGDFSVDTIEAALPEGC